MIIKLFFHYSLDLEDTIYEFTLALKRNKLDSKQTI